MEAISIEVVDMHTGGEPLRIITRGYPPIEGATILDKRRYVRENLDGLRKFLMFEPRGHMDMYGALLVEPSDPQADLAVLFMHNEGYSTMCGHAIIALGRYAVERRLVDVREGETVVRIECPCGLVTAHVAVKNGRAGEVWFSSVPAFLLKRDLEVEVPGFARVTCDVAYGGAFYALVEARELGLEIGVSPVADIIRAATSLTASVNRETPILHPDHADLGFLYGAILTDGGTGADGRPTRNVCVFAEGQVDRSPTGSGVTARLAQQHARGQVKPGERRVFESITGSRFWGEVEGAATLKDHKAVTVRVGGKAHFYGEARFWLEEDDDLGRGFLVR
ncbi:proline racemase family protein [Stappia sp. F7233]|uniref:4-hydroxyproline epimerase n=1 Tax=Stappia albiluteola TaxID=2758565 RepID=A0A839A9F7_9HYPH|nr:proline racemase family protein [Stappia albiluteola]MBA5776250.1 proline racemase family protein [Stappia albiluteola]